MIYIQTPFRSGNIYEDDSVTSPEDRKKYFGQKDHVRIYSPEGLTTRIEATGFSVTQISNSYKADNYNGFKKEETILVAQKG